MNNRSEQQIQIWKQRSNALLIALVGENLVDAWWNSKNKAFDNRTPAGQWIEDPESVYDYLMNHSGGDYS